MTTDVYSNMEIDQARAILRSNAALIAKIQHTVHEHFAANGDPDERWSDYDVLDQGVAVALRSSHPTVPATEGATPAMKAKGIVDALYALGWENNRPAIEWTIAKVIKELSPPVTPQAAAIKHILYDDHCNCPCHIPQAASDKSKCRYCNGEIYRYSGENWRHVNADNCNFNAAPQPPADVGEIARIAAVHFPDLHTSTRWTLWGRKKCVAALTDYAKPLVERDSLAETLGRYKEALLTIRDHEPPFLGTDCRSVAGKALGND